MRIGNPRLFMWFLPDKRELYVMACGVTESQIIACEIANRIYDESISLQQLYWMYNQDYGVIDEPFD